MSLSRKLLSVYRRFQYTVFGRQRYGVMEPGQQVNVEAFRFEINHGDVVHPCVRYIPEGYLGHKWWLVYTPYYRSDASLEQPVLCYAECDDAETPPIKWKTYCLVNDKLEKGYNSDPTLLYHKEKLYVYWRENYEKSSRPYYRGTFAALVTTEGIERLSDFPVVQADDPEIDPETCPTFMPSLERNGGFVCYGMHLKFHSKWLQRQNPRLRRILSKLLNVVDLLGIYSVQKHYGIAIWESKGSPVKPYKFIKTVKFRNCNKLYRPWHMDFFDYDGKRYAIVQTNMSNADLCLAESSDGETFTLFKQPLITNKSINKVGIYKPCAAVTPEGGFYLYYSAQDIDNRSLNKLYLTQMSFDKLIEAIK